MFKNAFDGWHIVILVLAFILLFGYKKLPDAARSVGQSLRIFKAETKSLVHHDEPEVKDDKSAPAAAAEPVAVKAKEPVPAVKAEPVPPAAAPARAADQERV